AGNAAGSGIAIETAVDPHLQTATGSEDGVARAAARGREDAGKRSVSAGPRPARRQRAASGATPPLPRLGAVRRRTCPPPAIAMTMRKMKRSSS
ncbi:hypothetical protein DKP78_17895, partial [Enterococcus faecium]